MLRLWLARHSEAVDPDAAASDFDRSLTPAGRRRIASAVQWLIAREEPPELILHSPLVRARQTAEVIAEEVGVDPTSVRVEQRLAPGVSTEALLAHLSRTAAERVLCIGHQPDMSRCLAEMLGGGHVQFSPGSIACVDFSGPILQGAGTLRWMQDPRWFG